jgi:hypothetical protein
LSIPKGSVKKTEEKKDGASQRILITKEVASTYDLTKDICTYYRLADMAKP